jgi:hypothetical protein
MVGKGFQDSSDTIFNQDCSMALLHPLVAVFADLPFPARVYTMIFPPLLRDNNLRKQADYFQPKELFLFLPGETSKRIFNIRC